ncbi:MAG: bifunctional pyr operon transcriptional regulator/uracil phosphoribosyltransferase [Opitutales bacterium]
MADLPLSSDDLQRALKRLAREIGMRLPPERPSMLLGLANGGVPVARRLAPLVHGRRPVASGVLNPMYHRDDFAERPVPFQKYETHLPLPVDGASVVLVDDVIQSGRTVRAALGELFSHGRPSVVLLAVLADRGHRRLPIQPDLAGVVLNLPPTGRVSLRLNEAEPHPADALMWATEETELAQS